MKAKSVAIAALTALFVAVALTSAVSSLAAAQTVFYAGTPTACNNATPRKSTIQAAVTAVAVGGTVNVCPGTFNESVLVNKKVIIKAMHNPPDLQTCTDKRTTLNPATYSILDVPSNTPGFDLEATGITIQGLVIEGADNGPGGGPTGAGSGIFTSPSFSGYTIKSNLIQDNSIGVYFNSSGTSTVTTNCIRDNNTSFGVGAAAGNGIYSDQGLKSATISQNHFWDNESDDMVLTGTVNPAVQTAMVSGNISSSSAGFLTLLFSTGVTVSGNIISNTTDASSDDSAAILLWGSNTTYAIKGNIIQNGAGSAIVFDVLNCCGVTGPNTTGTVSGNIGQRMGGAGLYAADGSANGAAANSMEKTTVSSNIFGSNGVDGIHIAKQQLVPLTTITKNTFTGNVMSGNTMHDCHDNNNKDVWTGNTNIGHKVNKAGLCFPGDAVSGPQNYTIF